MAQSIIFSTHEKVHQALYQITSLSQEQKEVVYEALAEKIGNGGVTSEEFKQVIKNLREKYKISEIDKANLLALMK